MRQPRNDVFCIFAGFVFFMSLVVVILGVMFVCIRRTLFELNAKKYIGKSTSELWRRVEKSDKFFTLGSFFIGANYTLFFAENCENSSIRAYCRYNGQKCIVFLIDHKKKIIVDCYTTKPLPGSFDGSDFIGQSYESLYESLGRPATDGKFGKIRIIHYLLKGRIFLSNYIYRFLVNDDGIIEGIELHREFVA